MIKLANLIAEMTFKIISRFSREKCHPWGLMLETYLKAFTMLAKEESGTIAETILDPDSVPI